MTSTMIDRTDGLSSAAAIKGPCRAATTANITLYAEQTIDGIAVVTGDRVLVKDQTAGYENGIYVVDTGQWRRSKDFNRTKDVVKGTAVFVTDGTANAETLWVIMTSNPVVVGTTSIVFSADVLIPPNESVGTAQLEGDAVTNAKLANVPTATIKGRSTAGTGDPEDLTVAQAVEVLGLTYIKDYGSHTIPLRKFRTTYVDPSDWTSVLQAAGDSGEKSIRVQGDAEVTFTDQWSIETDGQKWIGESMDNKSYLRRTTDVDEAAILVMGERCGMRRIGLKGVDYTSGGGVAKTAANAGILVARPAMDPVDLDFEFDDGYISEFYYCVSGFGRGITVSRSLLTATRYAVNFDWPAPGTYIKDRFVGDQDGNGFRRQVVSDCEGHSIAVALVRNRGDVGTTAQAANIKCVIENNKLNFGKGVFAGYLGDGSVIQGNVIQNASNVAAAYTLDGGTNWVMSGNKVYADRTVGGFPEMESFIQMTGQHTGFVIDGFSARGCTNHGIDMRSGDFVGVLRNIDLAAIGSAGAGTYDGVLVLGTGANTEVTVDGVSLRQSSAARSVVRIQTALSVLKHRGIVPLGAATPATSGSGTITAV